MTTRLGLSVVASLAAAAAYGVASALQHDQSGQVDKRSALDPSLLVALSRRPVWLLGISGDVLGVILQSVGLRYGPVVLVQPLLVAALPIAVVLAAAMEHRRPTHRESLGLALCTAGLAIVVPASLTAGQGRTPGPVAWTLAGVGLSTIVAALLVAGRRAVRLAPVATGIAAGIATGSGSVLLAVCAVRFQDPLSLLRTPAPYAVAVVGVLALLLTQAAFQTGAIAAPLAALSITEPGVAVLLAVTVLHERLPGSAAVRASGAVGAVTAVGGVLLLALSRRKPDASG